LFIASKNSDEMRLRNAEQSMLANLNLTGIFPLYLPLYRFLSPYIEMSFIHD